MRYKEFIQSADALLFSSEFQELESEIEFRNPNIWHILGISRREQMMSSFLTWLLNPQANHSFGSTFLKEFLILALRTEAGKKNPLTPVQIKVMDLSEAEATKEYWIGKRRCDILVYAQSLGLLCVIENKIDAKESQDQTKDYFESSFEEFPQDEYPHRVYIFLTPGEDIPQDDNFIPFSYQDILCMTQLPDTSQFTDTEQLLLQQFTENILRGIAMDSQTLDLAQAIYDQHQELFEFIFANVERVEEDAETARERSGWDGKSWFYNTGETGGYRWEDYNKHNFICAGGAPRYRKIIERYKVGDILYTYVSKHGYVGIAKIKSKAVPFREARTTDGTKLSALPLTGTYNASQDDDTCDWIALVEWEVSVERNKAVREQTITPATTGRVYEYKKEMMSNVRSKLESRTSP